MRYLLFQARSLEIILLHLFLQQSSARTSYNFLISLKSSSSSLLCSTKRECYVINLKKICPLFYSKSFQNINIYTLIFDNCIVNIKVLKFYSQNCMRRDRKVTSIVFLDAIMLGQDFSSVIQGKLVRARI